MTDLNSDELARFAYLALLGAAILAGVLAAYRGRIGTGLRDAAIWVLIILGFVGVYGLKDDLRAALFPGSIATRADGALELHRGRDNHFRLDARVNGEPVTFLVDTGASDLVLTRDDARRAGIDPAGLNFAGYARTANGGVRTAQVRLDALEFGGFSLRDVPAVVTDGELFQSLLGMTVISQFAKVSMEGDRLRLEP